MDVDHPSSSLVIFRIALFFFFRTTQVTPLKLEATLLVVTFLFNALSLYCKKEKKKKKDEKVVYGEV